jgi:hypothetical protein
VQDHPQRRRVSTAAERFHAQDAAGYCRCDENGFSRTVNQDRLKQVEHTNDGSADQDGGNGPRSCG